MENKTVLITGATSGIGEATAKLLAKNDFNLILCGRRAQKLEKLKAELSKSTKVTTLSFDVCNKTQVKEAFLKLAPIWKDIHILINNAGGAHGLDPIQTGKIEDWDAMIDSNLKGLLYVTHEVLPVMVKRKSGHIVNIGSIAGQEVYPNGNVYCASKFAVKALSNGMRIDLNSFGVKVTQISPGLVETEFSKVRFKGNEQKAKMPYKGITPLSGNDIAEIILYTVTRAHHVMIADIVVLPTAQASAGLVNRNP